MSGTLSDITEVLKEMKRQISLHGVQNLPDGTGGPFEAANLEFARSTFELASKNGHLTWRDVMEEEIREVYAESDPAKIREELVQVIAVGLSWIRDLNQRIPKYDTGVIMEDSLS